MVRQIISYVVSRRDACCGAKYVCVLALVLLVQFWRLLGVENRLRLLPNCPEC